jgi:hypothetical protein
MWTIMHLYLIHGCLNVHECEQNFFCFYVQTPDPAHDFYNSLLFELDLFVSVVCC